MNVTFPMAGMARVLAVGLLCSTSLPARAANKFWSYTSCGNSLWVYNCWSSTFDGALDGTGQPKNGDSVYLYNASATDYTVTFRNSISPIPTLNLLNIDAFGAGAMNLGQYGYDLKTLNENVGILGRGLIEQAGGTHTVSNTLSLGVGAGSLGTFTASDGAKVSAGTLIAGNYGSGVMGIKNGADLSTGTLYLAANGGSVGIMTVDGPGSSLVNSGTIYAGHTGLVGTLAVNNGATATSNSAYVGYSAGSIGGITVDGAGSSLTTASTLEVARSGTGSMSVANGGSVTTNGPGNLGYLVGSNGAVTIDGAGSKWDINSTLRVGHQGTADIQVLNGAALESVTSYIGTSATGSGSVTVSGPGSTWTTPGGNMELGGYGNASLTIEDGGTVSTGALYMGRYAGSTATLSLSGSNTNLVEKIATLRTNGSLLVGGNLNAAGGSATLDAGFLSSINVNNSLTIWDAGALRLHGGEIRTKHFVNHGSMTLSTGLLSVSNGTFNSDSAVTLTKSTNYLFDDGTRMRLDLDNVVGNINGALSVGNNVGSGFGVSPAALLNITNGSVINSTAGNIGKNAAAGSGFDAVAAGNGIATVDGPGTQWNNSGNLLVAGYGTGDLSITNGAGVSNAVGYLGLELGSNGAVSVAGAGSSWTNSGALYIGRSGTGSLQVTGGAHVTSAQGIIGQNGNIYVCSYSSPLIAGCQGTISYVNSSGTVTVDGAGSSWVNSGDLRIGADGDGSLVISQGGVVSNVNGYIGELAHANGAVSVDGAGSQWNNSGNLSVGRGTLSVTNGAAVTAASLDIAAGRSVSIAGGSVILAGDVTGGSGIINLDEGLLEVGGPSLALRDFNIGVSGSGNYVQSGGVHTVNRYLVLGKNAGSSGTYTLNGGTLDVFQIKDDLGAGTFNLDGGVLNLTGWWFDVDAFNIGGAAGSNGSFALNSGQVLNAGNEYIGGMGTGAFTQNGGSHAVSGSLTLGDGLKSALGAGSYVLAGGTLTATDEFIGSNGTGSFTQSGGDHTVSGSLVLAGGLKTSGGTGSYNLSGTGSLTAGTVFVGETGNGNFTQTGGDLHATQLALGGASGTGSYDLGGTGTLSAKITNIGVNGGVGTFAQSGGSHTTGFLNLGNGAGSSGSYALSGSGDLSVLVETIGVDGAGGFTQNGGTHRVSKNLALGAGSGSNGTYDMNGGSLTVGNSLIGGAGTGTFNMAGGHLSVASLHTDTAGGGVDFHFTGGTLAADTVIGDLINAGGTLAPGNSPGVTTLNGDYTQTLAGIFSVELGGLAPGEYDILNVTGIASLGGTLSVDWYDLGGGLFNAALGDSFDILTAETLSGEFDLLTLALLGDGLAWDVSYLTDVFGTTDIVRLSVVSAVPVPAAVWLFASGMLGLVAVGRRRGLAAVGQ